MKFFRRGRGADDVRMPKAKLKGRATYDMLRGTILHTDPSKVGIRPSDDLLRVWGLVMDMNLDAGIATIVSLADGTTSMYVDAGGGVIGAGAQPAPAAASIAAVRIAERMVDDFPPALDAPLPGPSRTALTLLTFAGLRRIEEDTSAFEAGGTRFYPAWNAMQQVIHEIGVIQGTLKGRPS